MRPFIELLYDVISPDALAHRVKFYKHHNQHDETLFYGELETLLKSYIDSEMIRLKEEHFYLEKELLKSKATFEVLSEFREEQMTDHGQALYDNEGFTEVIDYSNWYLSEVKEDIAKSKYKLLSASATGNVWDFGISKRVYEEKQIYKLQHEDKSQMTFELPITNDEFIHVMFFSMPPVLQGSYFYMKRRFKRSWEILSVNRGLRGLFSPVLAQDMPGIPLRDYGKKGDFRFDKCDLEDIPDCTKLMKMYLMLGGQRPELPNENPNTLYFHHPDKVMNCKTELMESGRPNPSKHIYKSIYDPELEKQLRC